MKNIRGAAATQRGVRGSAIYSEAMELLANVLDSARERNPAIRTETTTTLAIIASLQLDGAPVSRLTMLAASLASLVATACGMLDEAAGAAVLLAQLRDADGDVDSIDAAHLVLRRVLRTAVEREEYGSETCASCGRPCRGGLCIGCDVDLTRTESSLRLVRGGA